MSRSWWPDRPLGVKLATLVLAGSLALVVFGGISVTALHSTGERTEELLRTTTATGSAAEADMMHDAVRADVLQALLSGSGTRYDSAVTDLADHAATLQAALAAVRGGGLGPDVVQAVDDVADEVAAYLGAGQQIVAQAGADPATATAQYPEFLAAFEGLEEALPTVGEAVGAEAAAAARASADQRSAAITASVAVGTGGVLVLGCSAGW